MNCDLSQGFEQGCRNGVGGSKEFYIIEQSNAVITVDSGVVTDITLLPGKQFFKYNQVKQTSEADEQLTVSEENGSIYAKQTVKLVLNKRDITVANEIMQLAKNLLVIIEADQNGNGWLYGLLNGLTLIPSSAKSGKAMGDRNGYEISFEGEEPELAPSVAASIIAGLVIPALVYAVIEEGGPSIRTEDGQTIIPE
jgi:hypothetical protein